MLYGKKCILSIVNVPKNALQSGKTISGFLHDLTANFLCRTIAEKFELVNFWAILNYCKHDTN